MPAKIRLQRHGRRKRPFYHVVVADARAPRDGKFIEKLGTYNPMTKPATIEIDRERAFDWLMKGAQPTDTVRAMLRFKGVMYRKHLMRGVAKGAITQEQADEKYQAWIVEKEAKIETRKQETLAEIKAMHATRAGVKKAIKVKEVVVDEHKPAEEDNKSFADSVEQTTVESASGEAPAVEEAPAAEEKAPEAPAVEEKVAEAPVAEVAAAATPATPAEADDLTKIEGIGPKVKEMLVGKGIPTFAALSTTEAAKIKEYLTEAGGVYQSMDPTTWPEQAKMAAEGKWDELKKWQDELDGGKVK